MTLFRAIVLFLSLHAFSDTERVEITPASLTLEVDEQQALTAQFYNEDGVLVPDAPIRWLTLSEVASVDENGTVTALKPGSGQIAALSGGTIGYATITVPELPPASLTLSIPTSHVLAQTGVPLEGIAHSRLGDELAEAPIRFTSQHPDVAFVDAGRLYGVQTGEAVIIGKTGDIQSELRVTVVSNEATDYMIEASEQAVQTGDVVRFSVVPSGLSDAQAANLRPAWQIGQAGGQIEAEGAQGVFVAEQPGTYRITALIGPSIMRTAVVHVETRSSDARLVQVGRGPIANHHSGDMWVFEGIDGRDYVYIGTFMHDWMKVWDVTNPENPILTDSLQFDARRINDIKIHPNNRLGIATREGASSRRNGIVMLDLSTPAHPTVISEYTSTVTGGVHNVWVLGDEDVLYAVHNGTSQVHILDISDPAHVTEVGRWGLDNPDRSLHDVIVQDGYAYVSYWNDGIFMLDAGAGTHGGTATNPVVVSQYKYPIGNTHTAWRSGRYLFVGDEFYPEGWDPMARQPIEARGYIHVIDYIDPENPVEVAKYEVPEAGAHNLWSEGDRLYIGYYQGGLRVVDISGELRGDLYSQGREIAVLKTIDEHSVVPNWPMTWGAQIFKGRIYSSDMNTGLWITKLEEPAMAQ